MLVDQSVMLFSGNYMSINADTKTKHKLECRPMPNAMAALPNIGGALCSTPQSFADAHCSSTVPQDKNTMSAFAMQGGHNKYGEETTVMQ